MVGLREATAYTFEALLAGGRTLAWPPIRRLHGGRSAAALTDAPPRSLLRRKCLYHCALCLMPSARKVLTIGRNGFRDRQSRAKRVVLRGPMEPGLLGATDVVCDRAVVALAQGCLPPAGLRGLPNCLPKSERDLPNPVHGGCEHVLCSIPSLLCQNARFNGDECRGKRRSLAGM